MNTRCYDSIFCYEDPSCPLFATCEKIRADEIEEKFLGDLDNWQPTGYKRVEGLPNFEIEISGTYDDGQPPGLSSNEET